MSSCRKKHLFSSSVFLVLAGSLLLLFILKVLFSSSGMDLSLSSEDYCLYYSSLKDKCDTALEEPLDLVLGNGKGSVTIELCTCPCANIYYGQMQSGIAAMASALKWLNVRIVR